MSNRIRRGTVMPEPRRIAIERAIALGWTPDFIVSQLGVSMNDVERVEEYLDALHAEVLDENGHVAPARQGCGTHAAFIRHQAHKEPIDTACLDAQRAWNRERMRARRCLGLTRGEVA